MAIQNVRKITCQVKKNGNTFQFIQALKQHKVYIMKLHANEKGTEFTIYEKDLSIVRRIRKKYKIVIDFKRPDAKHILYFHWSMLIGLMCFMIIPFICSLFIWQISIEDVSKERQVKLEQELTNLRVVERKLIKSLVPDGEIRQVLLANNHDLSWVHIKRAGTKMHITSVPAPIVIRDEINEQRASNLVALRKGVITHYDLRFGERLVPLHQTVNKGDILVTGILKQGKKDIIVGAEGKVFADYWVETSFEIPVKIVYDKFLSKEVKILPISQPWEKFQKDRNATQFVEVIKSIFRIERHTVVEKEILSVNEQWMKDAFLPMLRMRTTSNLSPYGKIKDEKILHMTWTNDTVKGKVLYYMNDNIAGKRPIHQGD